MFLRDPEIKKIHLEFRNHVLADLQNLKLKRMFTFDPQVLAYIAHEIKKCMVILEINKNTLNAIETKNLNAK